MKPVGDVALIVYKVKPNVNRCVAQLESMQQ